MPSPNPKRFRLALTPDTVSRYKRYDCAYYEGCLSVAAKPNWPQFHCNDCDAYVKEDAPLDLSSVASLYLQNE